MWLFLCCILFVSSCSLSLRPERNVEVSLPTSHPWEAAVHYPMSYRVVTSRGEVIRLERGQRSTTVTAPRGETVLVAAYPLDGQYPFSGVIDDQSAHVKLTQEHSRLIMGLLSVWGEHGDSLRFLFWPGVEALVAPCADTLDVAGTIAALLNGNLREGSVPQSGLTTYRITALPQGRWYSEREGGGSFWHDGTGSVIVNLTEGLTCYYCVERGVTLRLFVQEGRVVQTLQALPAWF
ncbi:MAG: hypothetical protein SPF89_08140 [Sphaerochaetaceae bacterium]|nr:hypothetical protein [Spirochaetales bacterium]MDY5500058.1 hypothetical protein [Sphaerochaetaceae bacterium]